MERNKRFKNRMENSLVYVEHPWRDRIIFKDIGRYVRLKVELIRINDIDNRNNVEEEGLCSNFDGRRVLRFNCLQGL